MKVYRGSYRVVVLAKRWAIKFPRPDGWRRLRDGLLANRLERRYFRAHPDCRLLCPVLLADPLGLFVVMPKARPLTDEEWIDLSPPLGLIGLFTTEVEIIPGEAKRSSLGVLDYRTVIIDYVDHP
jgi:hypothetical protein